MLQPAEKSEMTPIFTGLKSVNTILYCARWKETISFYRDLLRLPVIFSTDWFVEFELTETARLSIADQRLATIKSAEGNGITLALEVSDIQAVWEKSFKAGLKPTAIKTHNWNAYIFYIFDPEGHRLEFWKPEKK
jgi:predicted enzyme related to lactoylglutathione lyase